MYVQPALPKHHLSAESKDVVKLGIALIATMSALVLSLLVASAKSAYDTRSSQLVQVAADIILLDRALARYGPETKALFSQNMLEIAIELAAHQPAYEDLATNFAAQFVLIGRAMNGIGPDGMWDEEDGFYYDVLRLPDGSATRLKVRSMVGLLPLCAATVVEKWQRERVPTLTARLYERWRRMP